MTARTALTPQTIVRDAGLLLASAATPDATNGNIVASPGPFKLGILVLNGDSSNHSLIVRASGYSGVPGGGANSGSLTAYQPFAQAATGDLTIVCAHTGSGYTLIENLTTDRFAQPDGSVWLDWTASTSMSVWLWTRPYLP